MSDPRISQASFDLIVASEVGSKATFKKKFRRPEWPQGRSGITVAIGYDLGYATPRKIRDDWSHLVPPAMLAAMVRCSGVTGADAEALLPAVHDLILIEWDQAIEVFEDTDIPEWTEKVCKTIPGAADLPPDCLGALVSLAYNRGIGCFTLDGDRYREGRAIRAHVVSGDLAKVPAEIRSMSRLWPGKNERGLPIRREKEALLWESGFLDPSRASGEKPRVSETPAPLEKPKQAGAADIATGGGGLTSTGVAANQVASSGMPTWLIVAVVVGGLAATLGVLVYLRFRRLQPVLARGKG